MVVGLLLNDKKSHLSRPFNTSGKESNRSHLYKITTLFWATFMPPLVSDSYHGWQDVGRRPLYHTQVHCWFKLEFWNRIWNFKHPQIWKCAAPLPWSTSAALLKSRWQIMSRKMFEFHLLKSHLFLQVDYHIFILILPFSIFQLVLFLFFYFPPRWCYLVFSQCWDIFPPFWFLLL